MASTEEKAYGLMRKMDVDYVLVIFGGLTAPVITYFALNWHLGFAVPMAVGTILGCISVALAVLAGPETRGKVLSAELSVA